MTGNIDPEPGTEPDPEWWTEPRRWRDEEEWNSGSTTVTNGFATIWWQAEALARAGVLVGRRDPTGLALLGTVLCVYGGDGLSSIVGIAATTHLAIRLVRSLRAAARTQKTGKEERTDLNTQLRYSMTNGLHWAEASAVAIAGLYYGGGRLTAGLWG